MIKLGTGSKTFYLIAESVAMGMTTIVLHLTENKYWAKQNIEIAEIKAESKQEAKEMFRIRDNTKSII